MAKTLGIGTCGMALAAAVWLASLVGQPAQAQGVVVERTEFFVSVIDGEGNQRSVEADVVPYLPNRSCFGWRARLAGSPGLVQYREVLQLPEAPAFWSGEEDAYSPHSYSADRKTATTEQFAAPDAEGWISSTWCVVEGDPTGPHAIDVYIDGRHINHFDFDVKKLADSADN